MKYVNVRPLAVGWQVESILNPTPMLFRSGGAAEREGRRHAELLAEQGTNVTLVVCDRSGAVIEARVLPARAEAPAY